MSEGRIMRERGLPLLRRVALLALVSMLHADVVSVTSASGSGSASLPSDAFVFSFDGSTSDIAQQLYWRAQANDSATKITLSTVPDAITERLSLFGIDFNSDLSGLEQRAVLWDTGFVLAPSGTEALQVWTLSGYAMTELAVPYDEYNSTGCKALKCNQTNDAIYYASQYCNGAQMLSAARCVIEAFEDAGEDSYAMWSTGGDPDIIPQIRVVNHYWTDNSSGISYQVYAVHTLSESDEPTYGMCATNDYGSLVVPCYPRSNSSANVTGTMQAVTPSAWVMTWLMEEHPSESSSSSEDGDSGFNLILLIPIIGGAPILIALVAVCFCYARRRRQHQDHRSANGDQRQIYDHSAPGNAEQHPVVGLYKEMGMPSMSYKETNDLDAEDWRPTDSTEAATLAGHHGTEGDQTIQIPRAFEPEGGELMGPDGLFRILTTDAYLIHKRIPYDHLHFQSVISRGAYGEVWLCELHGEQVATKRLIQNKQAMFQEIQDFVHEIQLSASLRHPNIVRVVGVAWNTLYNLSMIIDYLPTGDLQLYLRKQGDLMTWARDKIHVAIGIARAIEYLHSREPVLIHRDLKSKNVLLTRTLNPQLIDFGVSRRRMEETMTAGVGTPYWTAPEVLNGERYTEQSDIYSFGVLLAELDTCQLPYYDAVGPNGTKMKPFQVLDGVMSGVLRPSFSEKCPTRIRRLGVACLQQDATRRPNARELVDILGG